MDALQLNQIIIGSILKEQRESQGLSQADIAAALDYKNYNYISMLENGRSNIPVKRAMDILRAYRLDDSVAAVFIKYLLPAVWEVLCFWVEVEKDVPTDKDKMSQYSKKVDARFIKLLDDFNLESYKPLIKVSK